MAQFSKFISAFAVAALLAGPAAAKNDGDGGDTDKPKPVSLCPDGEVMNPETEKCEKVKESNLSPEQLKDTGRALALNGHYANALPVLAAADQSDPIVLTYTGFSHRKMGDFKTGLGYYKRALDIQPDSRLTLQYMGEGYYVSGDEKAARATLKRLVKVCGAEGCEEAEKLAMVIAGGSLTY